MAYRSTQKGRAAEHLMQHCCHSRGRTHANGWDAERTAEAIAKVIARRVADPDGPEMDECTIS
ncbi:unnamed protein product [Polarella glacialis]|uniref:Uncharacterized protein n=1 Tax=Polarella glacialis TaxID=89957 RepID=A0A813EJU2_POLGL|nr:unnamed protein product [Polarella glacialis]